MVLTCSPTLISVSVSLALCSSILLSIIIGLLIGFVRKGLSSFLLQEFYVAGALMQVFALSLLFKERPVSPFVGDIC